MSQTGKNSSEGKFEGFPEDFHFHWNWKNFVFDKED